MTGFYLEVSDFFDVSIVRAAGHLTREIGDAILRKTIEELTRSGPANLLVDLEQVTAMDSSGIGELVGAYTTVTNRGGRLKLLHLPLKLSHLLRMANGTEEPSYQSRDDAMAALDPERMRPDPAASERLDTIRLVTPPESRELVAEVINTYRVLAGQLLKEPTSIYNLAPRRFEELIAELVRSELGWKVQLTPQTRDGGRDILAGIPSGVGELLCLIEVKRYAETRTVGVELVRQLWGTVSHEDASLGMLVTTSTFSPEAKAFQKQHPFRLGLKDNEAVFDWLRAYCLKVTK